ncbi:hypothetical protein [Capnocytophaga stomatis]|uniref:hypothetical protein n=1 Tax=Capnocytophaga stomatis TaxID=1848904 RepID=UPI00194E8D08|nr:hypothetical protein [Capnocytophaga stomatis]
MKEFFKRFIAFFKPKEIKNQQHEEVNVEELTQQLQKLEKQVDKYKQQAND